MKIKDVIGIDASKLTLDCCLHKSGTQEVFENTPETIVLMADWSLGTSGLAKDELLFVFEHTGLYTHQLASYLSEQGYYFLLVPGLEIKRSLGIARGKDDKADAKRIAQYGYRIREEVKPYQMPKESLKNLKRLMSMRRKLVSQRAGHITTLGEQTRVLNNELGPILLQVQQDIIGVLDVQITKIEKELDRVIEQDPELQNLYRLLMTIKGIGAATARFLMVYTVGFTAFKTWRKFASYCGIAPFPNRSGTSIRGRTKVSQLANKEGKTLLNLCACSAILCNPEMKAYYERRIAKGKNKNEYPEYYKKQIIGQSIRRSRQRYTICQYNGVCILNYRKNYEENLV